jgi:hypothetical protein
MPGVGGRLQSTITHGQSGEDPLVYHVPSLSHNMLCVSVPGGSVLCSQWPYFGIHLHCSGYLRQMILFKLHEIYSYVSVCVCIILRRLAILIFSLLTQNYSTLMYVCMYVCIYLLQFWGLNSGPSPRATPPALFCDVLSWEKGLRTVCPSWPQSMILLISASWVARITGVSHWLLALFNLFRSS